MRSTLFFIIILICFVVVVNSLDNNDSMITENQETLVDKKKTLKEIEKTIETLQEGEESVKNQTVEQKRSLLLPVFIITIIFAGFAVSIYSIEQQQRQQRQQQKRRQENQKQNQKKRRQQNQKQNQKKRRQANKPKAKRISKKKKQADKIRNVSEELQNFILQESNYGKGIRAIEAGGGGDCLFHSISLGLKKMKEKFPTYVTSLEQRLTTGKSFDMKSIRNIAATSIGKKSDQEFKEFFSSLLIAEIGNAWEHRWKPTNILKEVDPNTTRDNIVQIVNNLKQDEINNIKNLVMQEFERTGNCHWGTDVDIKLISEILNIGFIIFKDNPGPSGSFIYCIQSGIQRYPYYMLIYNQDMLHYQLASLIDLGDKTQEEAVSVYKCRDLPEWLLTSYNKLCSENSIECPVSDNG